MSEETQDKKQIVLTEQQKKDSFELQKEIDFLLSQEYLNFVKNHID